MRNPVSELTKQLMSHMLDKIDYAPSFIDVCGEVIRFETEKQGDKSGWYICFITPWGLVARFGDWREGYTHKWNSFEPSKLSRRQFADFKQVQDRQAKARQEAFIESRAAAKKTAVSLWEKAGMARSDHPYLVAKCINAQGIRQLETALIVPLVNLDGYLQNVQKIYPDGTKRFLKGGKKKGLFFPINLKENLNQCKEVGLTHCRTA